MRLLPVLARALLMAGAASAGSAAAWRLAGGGAVELADAVWSGRLMSDGWTLDTLVADLAAALLLLAVGALMVLVALSATSVLLRGRARRLSAICDRVTPRTCRRLVAACCGIGLSATWAMALPASADEGAPRQPCHQTCRPTAAGLAGLGFPDLPTGHGRAARPDAVHDSVVVHSGDSLWTIATSRLPAEAPVADIAALTRRLYSLNRATIGPDPDLIQPGMLLLTSKDRS